MSTVDLNDIVVLYVEDEDDIREEVDDFLSLRFKKVITACNGEEGLKLYRLHRPDILLSDIMMPRMDGLQMIGILKEEFGEFPLVVMTAFSKSDKNMHEIEKLGIRHTISKPVNITDMLEKLKKALEEQEG